jgi:hypothetical protein
LAYHPARHEPPGFFCAFCHRYWDRLKPRCNQRWLIPTFFSMVKGKRGFAMTARKRHTIDCEAHLRVITTNQMLLAGAHGGFQ